MTFFTLLCQIFSYHCCTAFCLPFITADTQHCLPGSLREIYCIYILLLLHFFRYVDAINCHFYRIFLGDPSILPDSWTTAVIVSFVSRMLSTAVNPTYLSVSPRHVQFFPRGRMTSHPYPARIQIPPHTFHLAQRERILFKLVIDPVGILLRERDYLASQGRPDVPDLSGCTRCLLCRQKYSLVLRLGRLQRTWGQYRIKSVRFFQKPVDPPGPRHR